MQKHYFTSAMVRRTLRRTGCCWSMVRMLVAALSGIKQAALAGLMWWRWWRGTCGVVILFQKSFFALIVCQIYLSIVMKLLHIAFTEITNYNAKALFYTSHGAMSGAVASLASTNIQI